MAIKTTEGLSLNPITPVKRYVRWAKKQATSDKDLMFITIAPLFVMALFTWMIPPAIALSVLAVLGILLILVIYVLVVDPK